MPRSTTTSETRKNSSSSVYLRAADLGRDAMQRATAEGQTGLHQARLYVQYHVQTMVGERGPVAIMSEIPSLNEDHRHQILEMSRRHGADFEALLEAGIADGSINDCDVRMTGNAIMGSINWIPKWNHGNPSMADTIIREFPDILTRGLAAD